ncbi:cytochrome P450 4T8 isoform X2 [Vanacampus margaritifer]
MSLSVALGLPSCCSVQYSLALLCLVAVVYKLVVILIQRRDAIRNFEAFTGPPGHWFFGHVLQFKQDGTDLDQMVKWGEQYPYAFPLWFGPCVCYINIHHPDYVKSILTSTEPKDDFAYKFIKTWIGDGLLVSHGQKWFLHRRLLTPGFHYDVLKSHLKLMSQSAQIMLDKWERYSRTGESFELFEHVSLMTLDTIMKCAFSCNSNCQTESGTNEYIKSVYQLTDLINLRFRTFPYHNDLIFYLSPHGFRFRRFCKLAHRHTEEVIRKRKEVLKEAKEPEGIQTKRNLDFLDILLLARELHRSELRHERAESGGVLGPEALRADGGRQQEAQDPPSAGASLAQRHPHQDQTSGRLSSSRRRPQQSAKLHPCLPAAPETPAAISLIARLRLFFVKGFLGLLLTFRFTCKLSVGDAFLFFSSLQE